jgi:hypothetical protein
MRHLRDGVDNGALEFELRILTVGDEIEAIRNDVGLVDLAVARRECRAEFAFVRVRRFVQIDVHEETSL